MAEEKEPESTDASPTPAAGDQPEIEPTDDVVETETDVEDSAESSAAAEPSDSNDVDDADGDDADGDDADRPDEPAELTNGHHDTSTDDDTDSGDSGDSGDAALVGAAAGSTRTAAQARARADAKTKSSSTGTSTTLAKTGKATKDAVDAAATKNGKNKGRATPKQRRAPERHRRTTPVRFASESIGELRKVVYPTGSQLWVYFRVVLVFVLFVIAYVSLLDLGFGWVILKVFGG